MPQLKPEDTTMIGLTLFNQLCQLARIANASLDHPLTDEQVIGLATDVCCYFLRWLSVRYAAVDFEMFTVLTAIFLVNLYQLVAYFVFFLHLFINGCDSMVKAVDFSPGKPG